MSKQNLSNHPQLSHTVYLLSGPLGVGKSTTAKCLARQVENSVLLDGDSILAMFEQSSGVSWEQQLRITWENIVSLTRRFILNNFHVIIDFVVEDELEWFCKQITEEGVILKYIILIADQEQLIERISKRGDPESLERSVFLLNQMKTAPENQPYLYDTTRKQPIEIVTALLNNRAFFVSRTESDHEDHHTDTMDTTQEKSKINVHGFNHVTVSVSNLEQSLDYYCHCLDMKLRHKGNTDAYLEWGNAWICLIQTETKHSAKHSGVDHVAFSIDEADFHQAVSRLNEHRVMITRGPIRRGKGWSINFLDPDGTGLELHTSNLEQRLTVWK